MGSSDDSTRAYDENPGRDTTGAHGGMAMTEAGRAREWKKGDIILDLYEVGEVLGRGGFGTVYRVRHRVWNKELAVKSLNTECALSGEHREAFMRECLGWVNLGLHPHIVSCYYVREIEGLPRIFSEYIDGGTLDDYIDRGAPGGWSRILELSFHCLEGLAFAHRKGVIHLDVKPQNCLLTKKGKLVITDFGIASGLSGMLPVLRAAPADATLAMTMGVHGQAVGTKEYMPPEQWDRAYGEIGPWTDIYAFGSMLFQICCGELLFNDGNDSPEVVRARHLTAPPPDPVTLREDIPLQLSRFILKCLEKKPKNRYQSCREAREALIEVYREVTGEHYHQKSAEEASLLADGLNNRAVSLMDLGNREEAMKLWKQALELESHHPESVYNRGIVEWHEGMITDGALLGTLEELRKSHREEWIDEYLTALVHMETLNREAAIGLLDSAIEGGAGEEAREARKAAMEIGSNNTGLIRTLEGHAIVYSAAFSPHGEHCLSRGSEGSPLLHEVTTGRMIRSFTAHTLHIQHIAFSPDGAFATSVSADGLVCRWNLETGECIHRVEMRDPSGYNNLNRGEYTSAMTGDGRFVLGWNGPGNLELYDMSAGTKVKGSAAMERGASILALTGDGSRALLARKKAIVLWNVDSMSPERTFSREAYSSPGLISHDGKYGLWCGDIFKNDHAVYLWNIEKGEPIRSFTHHRAQVASLAATADFRHILTGDRRSIYFLKSESGFSLRTFSMEGGTGRCIALSRDEKLLLSDGADGRLYIWNIAPLQDGNSLYRAPLVLSMVKSTEEISRARSAFDSLLQRGRESLRKEDYGSALGLVREARSLQGCRVLKEALDLHWEAGLCGRKKGFTDGWQVRVFTEKTGGMYFCGTARRALSGVGRIQLWDVEKGLCLKSFPAPGGAGLRVFWRPADSTILAGTVEGKVTIIHGDNGEVRQAFTLPREACNYLSLCPDHSKLLLAGADGVLRLWDLERKAAIATMKGPHQILLRAACSGNGKIAAAGGNDDSSQCVREDSIGIWDLSTGAPIQTLKGHRGRVWSLALNFDGSQLCSGGGDHLVKIWKTRTGECVRVLEGHTGNISALALTMCGEYLFSGSDDRTIRLWKVHTGECLRTFTGHPCQVTSLSLTPDGRFLLSGDYQGESRLWEMEWDFQAVKRGSWDDRALPYIKAFIEHRGIHSITEQKEETLRELEDYLKHSGLGWMHAREVRTKAVQVSREMESGSRKRGDAPGAPGTAPQGTSCMFIAVVFFFLILACMVLQH